MVLPIIARLVTTLGHSQASVLAQRWITNKLLDSHLFHRFFHESERRIDKVQRQAERQLRQWQQEQEKQLRGGRRS
ncbi:hypothetical protein AMAG_20049 [Allomyces macrogynus ATCC 38327]|uniref:Uncharacterized protein n=1 Tax=Allomyces macrogynus (strain ATCC 38327) TaxID=578462 RepID=A0A0L0T529_ALLM3|nr:hypothetical protein AMAG_20049 [Allomyces macrogynus ATCC 38327]|eukprot:KNE69816.1 hypothetical protein AMAG_20049 [Allomyces macrogynus ATCC 38327]